MTTCEKYTVTLRCRPEEGCNVDPASDGEVCVRLYPLYAASRQEALEGAFAAHVRHCEQPCGICEVTTEAELVSEDIID